MAKRTSPGDIGDAPPSTARDPNPAATGLVNITSDDELVERTVTIDRPREELYAFWRDFTNLALFMENIASVTVIDPLRSHWVVKAPADATVEWDSIITEDIPGEVIAWSTAEGADVPNSGRIEFRDTTNGRGTMVTATIAYDPPAGAIGKLFAKIFQREPNIQARRDLRRFKQLMETGEIATSAPPFAAPRGE
ncbi:MAG TPA: SRPBCC family protein [Steroidobacteraceae bacterium]|nr:SRPBCC family protein [Steroidobacteraceae bacterium]